MENPKSDLFDKNLASSVIRYDLDDVDTREDLDQVDVIWPSPHKSQASIQTLSSQFNNSPKEVLNYILD